MVETIFKPQINVRSQSLNRDWVFSKKPYNALEEVTGKNQGRIVQLPHDYMLEDNVKPEAVSGPATGYYDGSVAYYQKKIIMPMEWKNDQVILHFDGVMQNATVELNGGFIAIHHYGYTPFDVDLTPYIYWGRENRISVMVNTSMQPCSRWYTGGGIYRPVTLIHRPKIHVATDGIYTYTERLEYDEAKNVTEAYMVTETTIENQTPEDHVVKVTMTLTPETFAGEAISRSTAILVKAGESAVARIPVTVDHPVLWDENHPDLYTASATVEDKGTFGVVLESDNGKRQEVTDSEQVLTGIRVLTADARHGLRINGRNVKLKGGCIHHDHGILGAVSLYDSENRKLKKMKNAGYNAVRLAHNPQSAWMLEACDRLGLYVFNEAFDAWGIAKQPGDYSQFFKNDWEKDMDAFILRDRNHPSVIFWSTGNEIFERGGLGNGYALAAKLAEHVRSLDRSRLVTNGLCSYWSGLDDETNAEFTKHFAKSLSGDSDTVLQNASTGSEDTSWEERSEAFVSALDVVGYNYMDDHYEMDGKMYPERVIVGTESYPSQMVPLWDLVEKLPYVIGDFTWTSYDYIGEAGIGKSIFVDEGDPRLKMGPFALMSHSSEYPWRLANDADMDINGGTLPQGAMRQILWGSNKTFVYCTDPANYGKIELISAWGWPDLSANWNWPEAVGKHVQVTVYSAADNVALYLNGELVGTQKAGKVNQYKTVFDIVYAPGVLEAVSVAADGTEISRKKLVTSGAPAKLRLTPEKQTIAADGTSLCYVAVEVLDANDQLVTNSEVKLRAKAEGAGFLAGFGSANPKTDENYTTGSFTTYRGRVMAVIRSGYEAGTITLKVGGEDLSESVTIEVQA